MKKRFITLISLLIISILAGCGSQTYLTPFTPALTTSTTPSYQAQATTSVPTPTTSTPPPSSSSGKGVVISYSGAQATQIGTGSYPSTPKAGNVYEILTYTITNYAYNSFTVNPFDFDLIVNSIKYGYSSDSYYLPSQMPAVDVLKGGSLTCALAFEIPAGSTSFTPFYDDTFGLYNIQWVAS